MAEWKPRYPDGSLRWSYTAMGYFLECPRKFQHAVLSGLVPKEYRSALEMGLAFHAAQEAAYKRIRQEGGGVKDASTLLLDGARAAASVVLEANQRLSAQDRYDISKVVSAYWEPGGFGARTLREWEVILVEEDLRVDLRSLLPPAEGGRRHPPVPYSSRVDILVRVRAGDPRVQGLWVPDWKTTSRLGKDTVDAYLRSSQFLGHVAACGLASHPDIVEARERHGAIQGVLLCLALKPTASSPNRVDFLAEPMVYGLDAVRLWAENLAVNQRIIRSRLRRGGPWPMNYNACFGRYGQCVFYDLCHNGLAHLYTTRDKALGERPRYRLVRRT